jgi:lysozyme family protein
VSTPIYTSDFNDFFEFLKEWEGTTYEDDPDDPGGATKYGIDQRSHPDVNIKALTEAQAKAIYWHEWTAENAVKFPEPLRQVYFNYCVNTGTSRAAKLIQQALGVTADGKIGPITMAAIAKADPMTLALATIEKGDAFYRALNRPKFLQGWLNRNKALAQLSSTIVPGGGIDTSRIA